MYVCKVCEMITVSVRSISLGQDRLKLFEIFGKGGIAHIYNAFIQIGDPCDPLLKMRQKNPFGSSLTVKAPNYSSQISHRRLC